MTIIFLILVLFSQNGLSKKNDDLGMKNVYLIIVNRLTLTDIEKMPNVKEIIDDGSLGLMNTRGANGYDGPQGYITINCSRRATANHDSGLFFNINPRITSSYKRRTGQGLNDSQIVNTDINCLINMNKDVDFTPSIGALGDNLHQSGFKTAVFGNSDTADSFVRTSCLIATDSDGRIDYGNVDDILVEDEEFCYGYRTDYSKLYNEVMNVSDKAHLIVIETGDLNRLNSCKDKMSDEMFIINRKKVLSKIDDFIGTFIDNLDKSKSLVIITSPNREESAISNSKLSPIILWGSGVDSGVVTSNTTRREGLVSNVDIAPTITSFLQGSNTDFIGQPIENIEREKTYRFIEKLSKDINSTSLIRFSILKTYNVVVILVPLIALVFLVLRKQIKADLSKIIRGLLLSCLAMPVGFLLMSLVNIKEYFSYFLIILLFILILNIVIFKIGDKYGLLLITSSIALTIIIDLLTGGMLIKSSVIGYDPIIGARYFGIGNELLGVLLGTIAILCGSYLEIFKRHFYVLTVLAIIIVVVLYPDFGANFGGSIAIISMSLIFIVQVFNIRINLKTMSSTIIVVVLVFIVVTIIDVFINKNPSHLGKVMSIVIEENPLYIFEILSRKLKMNIKLIGITIWSKTLYFSLFYILLSILILKDTIKDILSKNKYLTAGFISTLIGSIIGLLANDSGIIMASISIIYVTNSLLYVTIVEVEKK